MNLRLALLGRSLSHSVKLRMLEELARIAAEGFGAAAPKWAGSSFAARLAEYARFTAHEAECLVAAGDDPATEAAKDRLRAGATQLGVSVRATLGIRGEEEAFTALKLLYRQIGIDVGGRSSGAPAREITVGSCYFADYYSESVCRVIEALDQGLVAGLFDGGSLEFFERLTGGRPCCRALLRCVEAQR